MDCIRGNLLQSPSVKGCCWDSRVWVPHMVSSNNPLCKDMGTYLVLSSVVYTNSLGNCEKRWEFIIMWTTEVLNFLIHVLATSSTKYHKTHSKKYSPISHLVLHPVQVWQGTKCTCQTRSLSGLINTAQYLYPRFYTLQTPFDRCKLFPALLGMT